MSFLFEYSMESNLNRFEEFLAIYQSFQAQICELDLTLLFKEGFDIVKVAVLVVGQ